MPIEQCNAMVYVALRSVSFQELIPFMRIGVLAVPLALTLTVAATATQAQEPGAEVRVPSETGGRPSAGALRIIAPDRHLAQAFRRAGSDLETRLVCGTGRTGGLVGDGERGTWASTEDAVAGALGLGVAGRLTPMRVVLADIAVRQGAEARDDTTVPWLLALTEYWRLSGDHAFVAAHWRSVARAVKWAGRSGASADAVDAEAWIGALEGVREMVRAEGDVALGRQSSSLLRRLRSGAPMGTGPDSPLRKASPLEDGPTLALAHYRDHRAWAGEALLREVVAGGGPFGVSESAHFLEAMVRGVLGLEVDAPHRAVQIAPHLPATWDSVAVENIRVGQAVLDVRVQRTDGIFSLHLRRVDDGAEPVMTRISPALPLGARVERVRVDDYDVPLHAETSAHDVHPIVEWWLRGEAHVEIEYRGGVEVVPPGTGARVLEFRRGGSEYVLLLEGRAGTDHVVELRAVERIERVRGAWLEARQGDRLRLHVRFPESIPGAVRREVRFTTGRRTFAGALD